MHLWAWTGTQGGSVLVLPQSQVLLWFLRFLINNLINNKMDTEPLFGAVQSWVRQERGGLSYGLRNDRGCLSLEHLIDWRMCWRSLQPQLATIQPGAVLR